MPLCSLMPGSLEVLPLEPAANQWSGFLRREGTLHFPRSGVLLQEPLVDLARGFARCGQEVALQAAGTPIVRA